MILFANTCMGAEASWHVWGSPKKFVGVLHLVKQQRKAKMATNLHNPSYCSKKFYCERDKNKSSSYPDDTNPTEVTDSHCLMKFPPNGRLEDVIDSNYYASVRMRKRGIR